MLGYPSLYYPSLYPHPPRRKTGQHLAEFMRGRERERKRGREREREREREELVDHEKWKEILLGQPKRPLLRWPLVAVKL